MDEKWWHTAVVYQVYLRSYADGNGDGVGDLSGLRARLSHIADLGADAIWVNPWYVSPMADGGYDIADYRNIDPILGSLAESEDLIKEAHALGLKVIIDIVPNHTSDQHPWFQAAKATQSGSAERDRYIFRTGHGRDGEQPPNDWKSAFGGSAWTQIPGTEDAEWYLHCFAPEQPDLNWNNPQVRAEFDSILRFWLERGVDGIRVDVANCVMKPEIPSDHPDPSPIAATKSITDPPSQLNELGAHEVYRRWRRVLDSFTPPRMAIGEIWIPDPAQVATYTGPQELHQAFTFGILSAGWDPMQFRSAVESALAANATTGVAPAWVLSNHDVVRHVSRYGGGDLGTSRARAAILMLLALPGSVYLYQGEELGLPQVDDLPNDVLADPVWQRSGFTDRGRDGSRVPIPWTGDGPSLGFSTVPGWLPQPSAWSELSVAAQRGAEATTLELYTAALRLRRSAQEHGILCGQNIEWSEAVDGVVTFARQSVSGSRLVCATNFRDVPARAPIMNHSPRIVTRPVAAPGELPANTTAWWLLPV